MPKKDDGRRMPPKSKTTGGHPQKKAKPARPAVKPHETSRTSPIPKVPPGRRRVDWAPAYFRALLETGNMTASAAAAGVDRHTVWERRKTDAAFAAAEEKMREAAADLLEDEAWRRAMHGTRRLKFCDGLPVMDPGTGQPYEEIEYSDGLLTLLLKAHRPAQFRDKVDHDHKGRVHLGLDELEARLKDAGVK
jgi:hypothetical protein